ncbi:MAG: hypothetical protein ABI433_18735, partial [Burkholderiaceae bacterium]
MLKAAARLAGASVAHDAGGAVGAGATVCASQSAIVIMLLSPGVEEAFQPRHATIGSPPQSKVRFTSSPDVSSSVPVNRRVDLSPVLFQGRAVHAVVVDLDGTMIDTVGDFIAA